MLLLVSGWYGKGESPLKILKKVSALALLMSWSTVSPLSHLGWTIHLLSLSALGAGDEVSAGKRPPRRPCMRR